MKISTVEFFPNYGSKFSHTFSMEKPFNYKPLKLPNEHMPVYDVTHAAIHKRRIISLLMPC